MTKSRHKIVVGGCSFTSNDFPSTVNLQFKMWPEIIAEKRNVEVINTATCGNGNFTIHRDVLNAVIENLSEVSYVYVMWSNFTRETIHNNTVGARPIPKNSIDMNLGLMYSLQSSLQALGVDYTFCQYSHPTDGKEEYAKYLMKSPFFDAIREKNFYGWPMSPTIGGFTIKDMLQNEMGRRYRISEADGHPNETAHELIAKRLDNENTCWWM